MIINPDDTCFNTGVTAKTVLTAMDAATTPRTGLLFFGRRDDDGQEHSVNGNAQRAEHKIWQKASGDSSCQSSKSPSGDCHAHGSVIIKYADLSLLGRTDPEKFHR